MSTGDLVIERCETGYVVYEDANGGPTGRKWAFETPANLAEFIEDWAMPEILHKIESNT